MHADIQIETQRRFRHLPCDLNSIFRLGSAFVGILISFSGDLSLRMSNVCTRLMRQSPLANPFDDSSTKSHLWRWLDDHIGRLAPKTIQPLYGSFILRKCFELRNHVFESSILKKKKISSFLLSEFDDIEHVAIAINQFQRAIEHRMSAKKGKTFSSWRKLVWFYYSWEMKRDFMSSWIDNKTIPNERAYISMYIAFRGSPWKYYGWRRGIKRGIVTRTKNQYGQRTERMKHGKRVAMVSGLPFLLISLFLLSSIWYSSCRGKQKFGSAFLVSIINHDTTCWSHICACGGV